MVSTVDCASSSAGWSSLAVRRAQAVHIWRRSPVHKNVWNVFESCFSGSPQGGVRCIGYTSVASAGSTGATMEVRSKSCPAHARVLLNRLRGGAVWQFVGLRLFISGEGRRFTKTSGTFLNPALAGARRAECMDARSKSCPRTLDLLNQLRGGAVWQLVGLITRRSQVQILPQLPIALGRGISLI